MRDRCFDKCVTKPGTSMSNSELTCLAKCCDRYIDVRAPRRPPLACLARTTERHRRMPAAQATKVVSGTVAATYKQAAQQEGLGGGLH